MTWSVMFFINSCLLGVGLAMDAFSVSLANGLNEPKMRIPKMSGIAGVYAGFQFLMPMLGWIAVHTVLEYFTGFQKFIPWIALLLLLYIGGKMLIEGIKNEADEENEVKKLSIGTLIMQGVATSIDALSVGFTIAEYNALMAVVASVLIGAVTFAICMGGLAIGKKFGTKLSNKAAVLGGVILIAIGLEIWIKGVFF
ncbi:MAG: manganese efflux pump MntP family protein [Clostridia bacterium]|nr:manganese efflux pump MntP family protein [Clostridia bacterium]